jgi:prepilin-type processing-associated H-X9-DG protein
MRELTSLRSCGRRGFTLLELLVLIAICCVLMGLTFQAVQMSRDAASRTRCASNLRQVALGVHQYSAAWHRLPNGCAYPYLPVGTSYRLQPGVSWQTNILPYVEQESLWRRAMEANRVDPFGKSSLHEEVRRVPVPVFMCPTDSRDVGGFSSEPWALTSYVGIAGTHRFRNDGMFHINYKVRFEEVFDGTSNTVMVGERPPGPQGKFGGWYGAWGDCLCPLAQVLSVGGELHLDADRTCPPSDEPLRPGRFESPCDEAHFWSLHAGGANFAFADGSVRFLRYSQSPILRALATRAGGESVGVE